MRHRCAWVKADELYEHYHDTEWGVPIMEDQKLFEFLVLESAQAGLSWLTVLRKRENYREAYLGFDVEQVARFNQKTVSRLINNPGIIRNRMKIEASISNAKEFIKIQDEFGSFARYIWAFCENQPMQNRFKSIRDLPAKTQMSDAIAFDMKKRGFKFLGSTVLYAHMQATGMVNDHTTDCFRFTEVAQLARELPNRL